VQVRRRSGQTGQIGKTKYLSGAGLTLRFGPPPAREEEVRGSFIRARLVGMFAGGLNG
jgi:hypothetical protein